MTSHSAQSQSQAQTPSGSTEHLPPEVEALVATVVARTRLRRREQQEIGAELRSHFVEAMAAGSSADEAIAAFGDPQMTAKQLRASAMKKRSLLDRAFRATRIAALWMVAAFMVTYAGFWVYLSQQRVMISFDPLKRMAALAPQATSPDEVAWPGLREAIVELQLGVAGSVSGMTEGAAHPAIEVGWPGRSVPGAIAWPEQVAWCEANQQGIAMLRKATLRPVLGFPIASGLSEEDDAVFGAETVRASQEHATDTTQPFRAAGVLLPHLVTVRGLSKVLCLDATVAASQGAGGRAVEDLAAAIRLSMLVQQPRFFICDLVALAMRSLAVSRAIMVLEAYPDAFSDADLQQLQSAMRSVPADLSKMDLSGERIFFEDFVQCTYTDDGDGDGWFNPDAASRATLSAVSWGEGDDLLPMSGGGASLLSPLAAVSQVGRRELLAQHTQWMSEMQEMAGRGLSQLQDMGPSITESKVQSNSAFAARHRLLQILLPAVSAVHSTFAADRSGREAVDTVAAALRFKRSTGAWPKQAADLVPAFLPTVPTDPWTSPRTPVSMATVDGDFRIWSIGRDRVDQGGVIPAADGQGRASGTTQPRPHALSDGDLPVDWVWYSAGGDVSRWFEESR